MINIKECLCEISHSKVSAHSAVLPPIIDIDLSLQNTSKLNSSKIPSFTRVSQLNNKANQVSGHRAC